jgi:hypothetical protein
MPGDVDSIDSSEGVITDRYVFKKMVKAIEECAEVKDAKKIGRILSRFIITSKSLGIESHAFIPEFNHTASVHKFNEEIRERYPEINLRQMHEKLEGLRDHFIGKRTHDDGRLHKPREDTSERGDKEIVLVYEYATPMRGNVKGKENGKGSGKGKENGKGREKGKGTSSKTTDLHIRSLYLTCTLGIIQ